MSKKEEQSEAFIKPIILDGNKNLNDNNWKLGLDYKDFTGDEVQCAFEDGWDAAINKACEWLDGAIYEFINLDNIDTFLESNNKFIEEFRKAMEE